MFRSGSYTSIDKASGRELRTRLSGSAFEGELRKEGE